MLQIKNWDYLSKVKLRDNTDNYWQVQISILAIKEREKLGGWYYPVNSPSPSLFEWLLHFVNVNTVIILWQIRETEGQIYVAIMYKQLYITIYTKCDGLQLPRIAACKNNLSKEEFVFKGLLFPGIKPSCDANRLTRTGHLLHHFNPLKYFFKCLLPFSL